MVKPVPAFTVRHEDEIGLLELPPLSRLRLRVSKSLRSIFLTSVESKLSPKIVRIRSSCCASCSLIPELEVSIPNILRIQVNTSFLLYDKVQNKNSNYGKKGPHKQAVKAAREIFRAFIIN